MYIYIYIYVYATCAAKDCHDGARSCGFVPLRCQMLGFEFGRFWKPMPVASWRPMSALIAHLRIRFLVCVGPGRLEVCHRGFLDGVPTTLLAFKLGLQGQFGPFLAGGFLAISGGTLLLCNLHPDASQVFTCWPWEVGSNAELK